MPPDIATPFGLVLHELATNAAKYGSLSAEGGRVLLSWKLGTGNHEQRLTVVWRECGGPKVEQPNRQGFGNILIGNGLPGATVHRDFCREGLICTIELDLSNIQQNTDAT